MIATKEGKDQVSTDIGNVSVVALGHLAHIVTNRCGALREMTIA